jgi:two-component system, LytTR family, response regulator
MTESGYSLIHSLFMRCIIIDDEPDNGRVLTLQLARHCPQVEVAGQYTDSTEGLRGIQTLRPELVFLDIEMPIMNGFQLLEQLGPIPFHLVFVTAYDQYAVRAFRFSALDYLLKPVDTVDLVNVVRRAEQVRTAPITAVPATVHTPFAGTLATWSEQVNLLRAHHPATATALPTKMALPHANGIAFVEISQILYAESDSNYTRFVLTGGETYLVSKTLGDVQEILESRDFLRVHRTYIVNLDHIKRLVKGEGTYLILSNGANIPVSRQQKERLLERFGWV